MGVPVGITCLDLNHKKTTVIYIHVYDKTFKCTTFTNHPYKFIPYIPGIPKKYTGPCKQLEEPSLDGSLTVTNHKLKLV